MISGMYIGEMVRLSAQKVLPMPGRLAEVNGLQGQDCTAMIHDETADLSETDAVLKGLGANFSLEQRRRMRQIATLVLDRSADLCAMALSGVIRTMQRDNGGQSVYPLTIGIDGSVFKCNNGYRPRLYKRLNELLGVTEREVRIVNAEDGS